MKKRKFNILLNIATLCLCVAVIAFGVYSAKQASLNVSGTIGFSAHNCEVYVAGQITGGIDANLNSVTSFVSKDSGATKDTFIKIGDSYNWNIGTMYFDDINTTGDELAKPITIELKVYNKSSFKVTFTFNEDFMPKDHLNVTVDNETLDLPANETEVDAHTINVTISLKDENFTQAVLDNATVLGDFTKWSQYRIEKVTEEVYINNAWVKTQTPKLVTTMGHSIVSEEGGYDSATGVSTPIRWYAFAVKGESLGNNNYIYNNEWNKADAPQADRWYSLYGVDMTNVDYKGKTFWFIQEYVVAGGYVGIDGGDLSGVGFNYKYSNNTYAQVDNNITSDVYDYLNKLGDYSGDTSFVSSTGIATEELYANITEREVDENYTLESNSSGLDCQFKSKFWLINYAELGLLCNQLISSDEELNDSNYKVKAYGINNPNGYYNSYYKITNGAAWWLRSPNYSSSSEIQYITQGGALHWWTTDDYVGGIRSAFQITL